MTNLQEIIYKVEKQKLEVEIKEYQQKLFELQINTAFKLAIDIANIPLLALIEKIKNDH